MLNAIYFEEVSFISTTMQIEHCFVVLRAMNLSCLGFFFVILSIFNILHYNGYFSHFHVAQA